LKRALRHQATGIAEEIEKKEGSEKVKKVHVDNHDEGEPLTAAVEGGGISV